MKVSVTMKDPDCLYGPVEDAVKESLRRQVGDSFTQEEADLVCERRCDEVRNKLARWFKYGEYLEVEFDLEAMTATVKEAK